MNPSEPGQPASPLTPEDVVFDILDRGFQGRCELQMPAIPAMLDHYLERLDQLFAVLGSPFLGEERDRFREMFRTRAEEGFRASPRTMVLLSLKPAAPGRRGLGCQVGTQAPTDAEFFKNWLNARTPPLFAGHPDAKILEIAKAFSDPESAPVLDVRAGSGRNALPLARRGHPVLAIDPFPEHVEQLRLAAETEGLPVHCECGDLLGGTLETSERFQLIVVADHLAMGVRGPSGLRRALEVLCERLMPGGLVLFNLFLVRDEPGPSRLLREMSQMLLCGVFTRTELAEVLDGLPLELVSDESQPEYEKAHLPAEAWPPTGWFVDWANGKHLYPLMDGQTPIELRWVLCRGT